MILLRKNQLNEIVTPLHDLANLANPLFWLIRLVSEEQSSVSYSLKITDLSDFKHRYSLFEVTEGVDITIKNIGDYKCYFYQMPNDTSTDYLDGEFIKIEKLRFVKVKEIIPTFTGTNNGKIYDGGN
jgi:hypothetical protein